MAYALVVLADLRRFVRESLIGRDDRFDKALLDNLSIRCKLLRYISACDTTGEQERLTQMTENARRST
jgi:hypothetical protein